MKKLYVLLLTITVINVGLLFVNTAKAKEKVVYMAGNLRQGTYICDCPAPSGDCMCAVHTD